MSHDIYFTPEFAKDSEKLSQRFESLGLDLKVFIETAIKLYHDLKIDNEGIKPLKGLSLKKPRIYEASKFACRCIKGKGAETGITLVYAHFDSEKRIELLEIYYKADKPVEDQERITRYYQ